MRQRFAIVALVVLLSAAAAVVFLFDPARESVLPACPFHALTGLWCPGCGSTRALHQLMHGHVAAAFWLNPLAVSLLPLVGYLVVCREKVTLKPIWIWVLVGVVLGFGVVRNIPTYPFTLLAP